MRIRLYLSSIINLTRLRIAAALYNAAALRIAAALFIVAGFAASGSPGTLRADTLRLNVGYWSGPFVSQFDDRMELDALFEGGLYFSRWVQPAKNQTTRSLYPFGAEYFRKMGPGEIVLGTNLHHTHTTRRMEGLGVQTPGYSSLRLNQYNILQFELQMGYRLSFMKRRLTIRPTITAVKRRESFRLDEFTDGRFDARTISSSFRSNGTVFDLGIKARFAFHKKFSIVGELQGLSPFYRSRGSMKSDQQTAVTETRIFYNPELLFLYERASARHEFSRSMQALGLRWTAAKKLFFEFGFRRRIIRASYPGFLGQSLVFSQTILDLTGNYGNELMSDNFIWGRKTIQKKDGVYFSVGYNMDLK